MSSSGTVGSCISLNKNFLNKISKTKSQKVIKKLIDNATAEELRCLVESAFNILNSNFKLPKRNLRKLSPYAPFIRQLSKARNTQKVRNIINQKGEGFPFAALLLPILASIITSQ